MLTRHAVFKICEVKLYLSLYTHTLSKITHQKHAQGIEKLQISLTYLCIRFSLKNKIIICRKVCNKETWCGYSVLTESKILKRDSDFYLTRTLTGISHYLY